MPAPELTAVTVGVHGPRSLEPVLAALGAQTIADRLEVVAVLPPGSPSPAPDGFARLRTVPLPGGATTGEAIARGVESATAPVVAYVEEHSWPRPDWAERLLAAHDGHAAAVSWSLENANPDSPLSWAHLLADFGPAIHPSARSPSHHPWHHTSYRREVLAGYGRELSDVLEIEWRLHSDIAEAGRPLAHAGDARSRHWNPSRHRVQFDVAFHGARGFGAARVERGRWGSARRALFAAAAPLVHAIRLRRTLGDVRRVSPPRVGRVVALLALSAAVSAAGEAWGYARGEGSARRWRTPFELDRRPCLTPADRRLWDRAAAELGASRPCSGVDVRSR